MKKTILAAALILPASLLAASAGDANESGPANHSTHNASQSPGHADHKMEEGQHGQSTGSGGSTLREGGQASFAAIQEIIELLDANPQTDWSKVDIDRLRRHLIDMDNVMMRTRIETTRIPGGARFNVAGSGEVIGSIQRMIAGHSSTMEGDTDWSFTPSKTVEGGVLEVTSRSRGEATKIRALGFVGMLTRGHHHQPHHLAMAAGQALDH